MSVMIRSLAVLLLAAGLAGCGVKVDLQYDATKVARAPDAASVVEVRSIAGSSKFATNRLASIREGYGIPHTVLQTSEPLVAVVKKAFVDAVRARGMLADAGAPLALDLELIRLDGNQLLQREAHATVSVTLVNKATAAELHQKLHKVDLVQGFIAANVGVQVQGAPDGLAALLNQALQQLVDEALSDPDFLKALKAAR